MKKLLILAAGLALALLASDAWAQSNIGFSNCRGTAIAPPRIDKPGLVACFEVWDANGGAAIIDSGQFVVGVDLRRPRYGDRRRDIHL
jgi:hypothetical protein